MNLLAPYGIWDARDKCWIGTTKGPNRYGELLFVRCALTLLYEMFPEVNGFRFRVGLLPNAPFKVKDTIHAKYDGAEAFARIARRAR